MFQESFQWVLRVLERSSKGIPGKFQICFKGVSRKFKVCSKKDFRVLQGSFKSISRKFQGCFKEKGWWVSKEIKRISIGFEASFVLQFCSYIYLIAATRAEGGLVRASSYFD